MVYVPGGEFQMGRDDGDVYERPAHVVSVEPFFIDKYEVTNETYAAFVKETERKPPLTWKNGAYPDGAGRRPVTGVTWNDADAYARWAGKRLPTEEEWEFAARGADGRRYPWGNEDWRPSLANVESDRMVDVGSYQEGQSPFGAFDMVGNAWEWTSSSFNPSADDADKRFKNMKVIRGCMYECGRHRATTTWRRGWPANSSLVAYDKTGFRCVKDVTK
jgi:formylglycine-generating enzyme required for sulfatase activity